MFDVAIATCDPLPEPDPDHRPLVDALENEGVSVVTWAWDERGAQWGEASVVLLRSTWDYYRHYDAFLSWAEEVDQCSTLLNPLEVIRWNSHKSYLLSLPMRGVPVVPTVAVEQGSSVDLGEVCDFEKWSKVVIKPAVGAGSYGAQAMEVGALDERVFEGLLDKGDVLVQPYMESIHERGERSLVFIDGKLTHGVRKSPRFDGDQESVVPIEVPDARDVEVARRAIDGVDSPLLYGRVDLIDGGDGAPRVAELELIEPSLFFRFEPASLERLVESLANYL